MKPMLPAGVRAVILDEIDSTNEEAKRRAEAGEAGPLWILARRQTAGRGRRGRSWESKPGNLTATLLLRPKAPPARAAQLSFAAGLAAAETFETLGARNVALKWPNDVLIGEGKAAGILLESSGAMEGRLDWLAIGFGLNLAWAPDGVPYPATCLSAETCMPAPSPEDALGVLAGAFSRYTLAWAAEGFAPIRTAWLAKARGRGEKIVARIGREEIEGVFRDLDEGGALILETSAGPRAISAGEVFFVRNS